ncbi:hypothetical protein TCSYLVIO_009620, partial [Trypanosoma cruzi]
MTLRDPTQRESGHCCRHGAISPAGLRYCLAHGLPFTAVRRRNWKDAQEEREGAHTAQQTASGAARTLFLLLTRKSAPRGGTARRRDATHARSSTDLRTPCGSQLASSVSAVPSLLHQGDLSASPGASSRREHRNSLPTSERRIEVLLPNLRQSALFRPQCEGTCSTCSARRSNSRREPHMRMPRLFHRHPNRRLARRSPPKLPGMLAGKTRRKGKRGHSRWTTGDSASSTAGMPRHWEYGLRLFGTAPARTTARMRRN